MDMLTRPIISRLNEIKIVGREWRHEPFLPQVWKLHDYTRMEAELFRLEKGTQSHPSTIPTRVEIMMNSFGVVNLVKENPTRHHPLGNLIEECKSMHKRSNSSINHSL